MAVAPPIEEEKESAAALQMPFFLELATVVVQILVPTEAYQVLELHALVTAPSFVVLPKMVTGILVAKLTKPLVDRKATVMTVMVRIQTTMTMSYIHQSRS